MPMKKNLTVIAAALSSSADPSARARLRLHDPAAPDLADRQPEVDLAARSAASVRRSLASSSSTSRW
jgi:hypothetical protein